VLWVKPYHLLGLTRQGNVIHFKDDFMKRKFYPWWFSGYIETRRPSTINSEYKTLVLFWEYKNFVQLRKNYGYGIKIST
jgi:hypothetical protein